MKGNSKSQSKSPGGFLKGCDNYILKFTQKNKSPWIAMLSLKKNEKSCSIRL